MIATATALEGSWDIAVGTPVHDAAGEKLGHVIWANPYTLRVGRGLLFTTTYTVDLAAVDRAEEGKLILSCTKDQLMGEE